ncbi:hypothetical protein BH18ACT6_BH18ACT6_07580 [soil metagenome]
MTVAESRAAQGLPETVTDPAILARIAAIVAREPHTAARETNVADSRQGADGAKK